MSYSFDQNYFQISQIFHLSHNPVSLVSSNLERKKENQQGQLGIRGGTGWPLNEVVRVALNEKVTCEWRPEVIRVNSCVEFQEQVIIHIRL